MSLSLDIVTPEGVAFHYPSLDRIVMRRGGRSKLGTGELVMVAEQGRMTASLPSHILRARCGHDVIHIEIAGGLAERRDDAVTILTRTARLVAVDQMACAVAS